MKSYFYRLLGRYIGMHVRPDDHCVELLPKSDLLRQSLAVQNYRALGAEPHGLAPQDWSTLSGFEPDYVILNGTLHYSQDIQHLLEQLHAHVSHRTRIIVCYYSGLWRPVADLATALGWRSRTGELNWFAPSDLINFSGLVGFEIVHQQQKVLIPVNIPGVSGFVNRFLAPLPFFRLLTLVNIAVLRPTGKRAFASEAPSVSIVVPARNEAGNIEAIVKRLPAMPGPTELIFIEGHSTDNTWAEIERVKAAYPDRHIVIGRQDGRGKGDAVRKGFGMATGDIFMILDADMTVPPEDLPKFYHAMAQDRGEFINGSRLVYPLEAKSMRFFNILGNKFFATAFSFVLRQKIKDTLCGTKVISRENYQRVIRSRSYFGDFDPFGDFDLLFGAARLGLRILEVPIRYRARTYGETNIQRWKHGWLLLKMVAFASRKIEFI